MTDIYPINEKLPQTADEIAKKNSLNSYLPIRNKDNDFTWEGVVAIVLSYALRKKIDKYEFEAFVEDCRIAFETKSEPEFWDILQQMYFRDGKVPRISPELMLFRAQKSQTTIGEIRIAEMFSNLLQNHQIVEIPNNVNFLEHTILEVLNDKLQLETGKLNEEPYLPFLAKNFQKDIRFLATKPKYFMSDIHNMLSLYGFSYVSQLALNIQDWKAGDIPAPKPLYFIMDHEKASNERVYIVNYGYRSLNRNLPYVFPTLLILEQLQNIGEKDNKALKKPLWKIVENVREYNYQDRVAQALKQFALAFRTKRELSHVAIEDHENSIDWLNYILKLSFAQFENKNPKSNDTNKKYITEIEKQLVMSFVQPRGRAGKVLVLRQDVLIMLTNLSIGEREQLRFHELLEEFNQRGVFVDKQTEQELIAFYERIGNTKRMSDSGDAVYVRKTI